MVGSTCRATGTTSGGLTDRNDADENADEPSPPHRPPAAMRLDLLLRILTVFGCLFAALWIVKKIAPIAGRGLIFVKLALFLGLVLAVMAWWRSLRGR